MRKKRSPGYIKAYKTGRLQRVAQELRAMLASCDLCPRLCRVNRLRGELGFCKTGASPVVYSYLDHHGEEPPISGKKGSGAIFFSHCNLACVYCQNFEFSQRGAGKEVDEGRLAAIMLELQGRGCHNINLVTPTHVLPAVLSALCRAVEQGLCIPLVYNTGGYERAEIIRVLDGIVDIYLPDMRYGTNESAVRYSCAPDYPAFNRAAVREMFAQVGKRGLIIRHLVLPGGVSGTEAVMKFLAEEISPDIPISLMSQYHPYYKASENPEINRRLSAEEYEAARRIMERHGLHNGWVQESGGLEKLSGVHIKPKS